MDGSKRNDPLKDATTMVLDDDRTLVIERTFRAAPRLVFEAWTNAAIVKKWWAPKSRGVSVTECSADVTVGGKYRYVLQLPDASLIAFSGVYKEVEPHTRLVYTQVFEQIPGAEVLVTIAFHDRGDKTHLVSTEVYPSAEARAAAIAAGMESGMRETMNQLDDLVAALV